jgi:hypothetical protein
MPPVDRPRRTTVGTALLVFVLLAGVAIPATTANSSPTLEADTVDGDPGEKVTITLAVTGASDVAGYQANVTFNPEVAQVVSVSGADFEDPIANIKNEEGWVFFTQSQTKGAENPQLATITFEIAKDAPGGTPIEFVDEDTMVSDADGNEISVSLASGKIQVESTSQTPTTTSATTTATPTTTTDTATTTTPTTTTDTATTTTPTTTTDTATTTTPTTTTDTATTTTPTTTTDTATTTTPTTTTATTTTATPTTTPATMTTATPTTTTSSKTTAQPTQRTTTESTTLSPTETLRTSETALPETTSSVDETLTTGGGGSGPTPGFSLGISVVVISVLTLLIALKRTQ